MKSYTDVEQSKKLAEILPIESADMAWCNNSIKGINYTDKFSANLYTVKEMKDVFDEALNGWDKYWKLIPCWSLAALLDAMPSGKVLIHDKGNFGYKCICNNIDSCFHDNPVNACVDMILKLYEFKML
jgi:hypothetical protein